MGNDALREALAELEKAEAHYRLTFQIAPSADHLDVGRAWDRMRKAGDAARAALAQSEAQPNVSAEMVQAYLDANRVYWQRIDSEPGKLGIWRNGTERPKRQRSTVYVPPSLPHPSHQQAHPMCR